MQFGSEEMKQLLLQATENSDMYEDAMIELHETVRIYTAGRLKRGFANGEVFFASKPLYTEAIDHQDYEDIIEDVFCNVISSLDKFICNLSDESYNESRRQAWLRIIVYRTIAGHMRKKGYIKFSATMFDDEGNAIEYEDTNTPEPGESVNFKDTVRSIVQIACKSPSKPEKILAYLFNVMIFRELENRRLNSSAKITCSYMNDKMLFNLKNAMLAGLDRIYGLRLTNCCIEPVSGVLGYLEPTEKGSEICRITPKLVTDWSNRMKTYMFKFKKEISGME